MHSKLILTTNRQAGFSMIEGMVAMFVLAIGLLGLAGLQASGLKYSGNAGLRSAANHLSQDIAERAHANRDAAASYVATGPLSDTLFGCDTGDCTPAQLASYDMIQWQALVSSSLPDGAGTLASASVAAPDGVIVTMTITINWTERQTDDKDTGSVLDKEIKVTTAL